MKGRFFALEGAGRPFPAPLSASRLIRPASPPRRHTLSGRKVRPCLGGECELIAMKLREEEKKNPERRKVLQRVIVSPYAELQEHYWGYIEPRPGPEEGAVCLAKDRFRIRVEGWPGDRVVPAGGWDFCGPDDCNGNIVIAVWSADRIPEETRWGAAPERSGHEHSYWIEYAGPRTRGKIRRAGPFGCTGDPVDHAMDDGGFQEPGRDGGYVIFDDENNVVDQGT